MKFLKFRKNIIGTVLATAVMLLHSVVVAQTINTNALTAATKTVDDFLAAIIVTAGEPISQRIDTIRPVVLRTHDLEFIGQVTIRRQWREFTDSERQAFLDAFKELSVASYAARFVDLSQDRIRRGDVSFSGDDQIVVATFIIRDDGSEVPIDYVLNPEGENWRIVNVIADGVSDIALKRAEYRAILLDGSSADLVAALVEQTEDLFDH